MGACSGRGGQGPEVIFHADDFGMTVRQSAEMLSLAGVLGGDGALSSVSIMVGSPAARESARLIAGAEGRLRVSLHLNLVEGPCTADPAEIPLLVDDTGRFRLGFAGLLARSTGPVASELERQIGIEVAAQIERFLELVPGAARHLRIDSHQHFHLIPVVFRSLMGAVRERGLDLEYLRIPAEPLAPFLRAPRSLLRVPPVNWVKSAVLNLLWLRCRRIPGAREVPTAVFFGIGFSGRMTRENVSALLPGFRDVARRRGLPLEVLFHPTGLRADERPLAPALDGFVAFYRSPLRAAEAEALRSLARDDHEDASRR